MMRGDVEGPFSRHRRTQTSADERRIRRLIYLAADDPDLARSLNNLSVQLADAGRKDESERASS